MSAERETLGAAPFHPDRDGCDCLKRGVMDEEECVHSDPCWIDRAMYEASLPKPETYTVSDERLTEIRALVEEDHPAQGVDTYQLAGAVYDLLSERDGREMTEPRSSFGGTDD